VPAATPVTTPELGFTVATAAFELDHEPPETEAVKVEVPAEHIAVVPLIVAATGAAVTVTVLVAVAFAHPPVPATVYVIVAVPAVRPFIAPVVLFIVAIAVFELVHVPPLRVELNVEVPPTQID
jgi:hypothetical protein